MELLNTPEYIPVEEKCSQQSISLGRGPSTPSIPICQPIWRPPGLIQTEVLGALGSTTKKARPVGFFLKTKKEPDKDHDEFIRHNKGDYVQGVTC